MITCGCSDIGDASPAVNVRCQLRRGRNLKLEKILKEGVNFDE